MTEKKKYPCLSVAYYQVTMVKLFYNGGFKAGELVMRSFWDVKHLLEEGKLVQILPAYTQTANIWAVYPTRLSHSAKLRVCVEFLEKHLKGI